MKNRKKDLIERLDGFNKISLDLNIMVTKLIEGFEEDELQNVSLYQSEEEGLVLWQHRHRETYLVIKIGLCDASYGVINFDGSEYGKIEIEELKDKIIELTKLIYASDLVETRI